MDLWRQRTRFIHIWFYIGRETYVNILYSISSHLTPYDISRVLSTVGTENQILEKDIVLFNLYNYRHRKLML